MRLRRKTGEASQDHTTRGLLHQGVYRVDVQDNEAGHFHHHVPFSFWSGVKYILILSVLLWWLPTFGQMIAGYVGGRRTGAAWKAVVAAIVPLVIIFAVAYSLEHGYIGVSLGAVASIPTSIVHQVSNSVPAIAPYVDFVLQYLAAFVDAMRTTLSMGSNGYLVTVVFAYIGGLMADQARREALYSGRRGVGVSITQPVTHGQEGGETIKVGRKTPVSFARMKKIPAAHAVSSSPSAEPNSTASSELEENPDATAETKQTHAKREPLKPKAQQQEVRVQHFVQKALNRYETERR